jgi:hypothetical protein
MYKKTVIDYEKDLMSMKSVNYNMEIQTEPEFLQGKFFFDRLSILYYKSQQILKVLDSFNYTQSHEFYELSNAYKEVLKEIYSELIETKKHLFYIIDIDKIEDKVYEIINN